MTAISTIIPKHNLFIIDEDYYYALKVKHSLGKKFGNGLLMDVFRSAESSLEALKKLIDKPHVLVMDHSQNKEMLKENGEHALDAIRRISPDTKIVILSDEKNKANALKTLGHGAQEFVVKDQFALDHIYEAVEKCFNPVKV